MTSSGIELLTIGAYLAVLLAVGVTLRRFNTNVNDYFRSGCQGTWWLVGASAFMGGFSAWTFTGAAGVAYEVGWSVMIIFIANAAGFFVNFLFLAPWFRQLRAVTVPEVVRARFGVATQQVYAWFSIPTLLLYSSLHLYALAIFSATVFGLNLQAVIVGVGLIVLFYSVLGGSWAVMSSDFLQTLVLMPMTILMAFLCLAEVGGIGGFFNMIEAQDLREEFQLVHEEGAFPLNAYTWGWAGAMFLQTLFASNSLNSASRYFAVKDGAEARKAALLGCVLMLLGSLIWFIPPMTARLLFQSDVDAINIAKPAEASYAVASMKLLPTGMTGLMIVAMFAATTSSMDSGLNRNAAILTRDVYPALCRLFRIEPIEGKALLRLGEGFSLLLGLLGILLAIYFSRAEGSGIFEFMLNIGSMLGVPLTTPMLLALFVRRVPWWAALFSTGCALVPSALSALAEEPWSFQDKVFINTLVGAVAFLATMPLWRFTGAAYRRQTERFFTMMHTPIDFEREVGQGTDLSQLRVIGVFAMVIGVLICLLMFVPNPMSGRLQMLFVGGCVALVGALFIKLGQASDAAAEAEKTAAPPLPSPEQA